MISSNAIHVNDCGLPFNGIEWLEKHYQSKAYEREQMIRDLGIEQGSFVVDAGCGPGLWTPLIAEAIGPKGRILGIDISAKALIAARERIARTHYCQQVQFKLAPLEQIPLLYGTADLIFTANVSQYLPDPVATFATIGAYLRPGGRLVVKDEDLGTMRFHNVSLGLQTRVLQAHLRKDQERVICGYPFEDHRVGSKLAGYLRAAGYKNIQEKPYRIKRNFPLSEEFRYYLQETTEWLVCEGASYLSQEDQEDWLECFFGANSCVLDREDFSYEETEYLVSGVWIASPSHS